MYIILVYDVKTKRNEKIRRLLSPALNHVQESVFVGTITDKTFRELTQGIKAIIDKEEDQVLIFKKKGNRPLDTSTLGKIDENGGLCM